jgi:hypothetical protein
LVGAGTVDEVVGLGAAAGKSVKLGAGGYQSIGLLFFAGAARADGLK